MRKSHASRLTGLLRYGRAVGEAQGLSLATAATLRALGDFLSVKSWDCWASIPTIAAHTHCSEATVRRSLNELEALGVIYRPSPEQRIAAGAVGGKIYIGVRVDRLLAMRRPDLIPVQGDGAPLPERSGRPVTERAHPLQGDRETDHRTDQQNKPREQTTMTGDDDDDDRRQTERMQIREALIRVGMNGKGLDTLCALGLPWAVVKQEIDDLQTSKPRRPQGYLFNRLHDRAGIRVQTKSGELRRYCGPELANRFLAAQRRARTAGNTLDLGDDAVG